MTGTLSVQRHFDGKSAIVRAIYERLLAIAREFGPVEEEPKKTSIHLVRSSALAGVETRKEYLLLNIKTAYPIHSPRVAKAEQLSAHRYHSKIKLASPVEVNSEVEGWLQRTPRHQRLGKTFCPTGLSWLPRGLRSPKRGRYGSGARPK